MIAPTPTIIGGVGAGLAVATQAEEVEVVAGRPPERSSLGEADQLCAIIVESPGTNQMCVSTLALSVSPRSTWQHVPKESHVSLIQTHTSHLQQWPAGQS